MENETSDDPGSPGWLSLFFLFIVLVLLAAIAIPNFVRARTTASKNFCMNNLRQIDGAKEQWALENKKNDGDVPKDSDLFGPSLYMREKPTCPEGGGKYTLTAVGVKQSCSLSNTPGHSLP